MVKSKPEERIRLVTKAINLEMQEIKKGQIKTKSLAKIKQKFGWSGNMRVLKA